MLTAARIARLVSCGELAWSGELRGDAILLRLGTPLQTLIGTDPPNLVDLAHQDSINSLYGPAWPRWSSYDLKPRQLVLCATSQPLRLGAGLVGAIASLSHLARVGLATHITSPWVLPGWNGRLTLELKNHGPATLRIYRDMPVARLILFTTIGSRTVAKPHPYYGADAETSHLGSRFADEFAADQYRR
ncbi:hypothetical protein F8280_11180 [Micromonospora noduli]|uniref:dCTP deaminase n=1 Tax=Micromonospora noduli TaxID=709876 RepID=UPI00124B3666|nr:hypothetical protein [Micromonospora noduli]KAB1925826.1 hypothetical protein F8280_11180 [Micromonospora noduli]